MKDITKGKCKYCGDAITLVDGVWLHREGRWPNDDRINCYRLYNNGRKAELLGLKNKKIK